MKTNIKINSEAVNLRKRWEYGLIEPIDVKSLILSRPEYTLIKMKLSNNISGMCFIDAGSKIIVINNSMSLGRQRYTIAHELYHIEIEHQEKGVICKSVLDAENKNVASTDSEREADRFASYFLLPYEALEWFIDKNNISAWKLSYVVKLSQLYQMSYRSILYRLHQEKLISDVLYHKWLNMSIVDVLHAEGADMQLYKIHQDEPEESFGEYGRLLESLKASNRISGSLYRQFADEGLRDESDNNIWKDGVVCE